MNIQEDFIMSIKINAIVQVYITNLGQCDEGCLVGQWLGLPATEEDIEAIFVEIGLDRYQNDNHRCRIESDGVYEEYSIHDYETQISGFEISEYSDLSDLNRQAQALSELEEYELESLQAACEGLGYNLFEIIDRVDDFVLHLNIRDEDDLGRYWAEESGCNDLESLGSLAHYIDYARFGRDITLDVTGEFTPYGFIEEVR